MTFKKQTTEIELPQEQKTQEEPSHEEYKFELSSPLRSPEEDLILNKDLALKEISYTQHEFIKMNEVTRLINEAMQNMLAKIYEKDKITQANKIQIRDLQTKLKQTETSVLGLLSLQKTTSTIFKKTKELQAQIDEIKVANE